MLGAVGLGQADAEADTHLYIEFAGWGHIAARTVSLYQLFKVGSGGEHGFACGGESALEIYGKFVKALVTRTVSFIR